MTPRRRYQQAAWTRRAILSGRCVRCGRKKTAVTRLCKRCSAQHRIANKLRYDTRKLAGRCSFCPQPIARGSKVFCRRHQQERARKVAA